MNKMHGALRFAISNISFIFATPRPTIIPEKSLPDAAKNGTFASPAIARASNVLPVPGSPDSNTPRGTRAPTARNLSLFLRKSTISINSCFSASMPATSLNVVFLELPVIIFVGFCAAIDRPTPRPIPRNKNQKKNSQNNIGNQNIARSVNGRVESIDIDAPVDAIFCNNSGSYVIVAVYCVPSVNVPVASDPRIFIVLISSARRRTSEKDSSTGRGAPSARPGNIFPRPPNANAPSNNIINIGTIKYQLDLSRFILFFNFSIFAMSYPECCFCPFVNN